MELVSENKLGVCRDSAVEEEVNMNFRGECTEVGLYLAMARVAMREGYPGVALAPEKIAWEEAQHATVKAKENGIDEAHDFFDVSARDEARHAKALKAIIDRYFS